MAVHTIAEASAFLGRRLRSSPDVIMSISQETASYPAEPPRHESKRGMGCLFWGCLITLLMMLLLMAGVVVAVYYLYTGAMGEFTANAPTEFPAVELTEEELAGLTGRFGALSDGSEPDQPLNTIELTAEELNVLIKLDENLQDRFHVRVGDDQIGGDVSLPMDMFPLGQGRFFNASVEVAVGMHAGRLIVTVEQASINGQPVPEFILNELRNENLAADAYENPETAAVLDKFESIEVVGDKLVLTPKTPAAVQSEASDIPAEEPAEEATPEPVGAN